MDEGSQQGPGKAKYCSHWSGAWALLPWCLWFDTKLIKNVFASVGLRAKHAECIRPRGLRKWRCSGWGLFFPTWGSLFFWISAALMWACTGPVFPLGKGSWLRMKPTLTLTLIPARCKVFLLQSVKVPSNSRWPCVPLASGWEAGEKNLGVLCLCLSSTAS